MNMYVGRGRIPIVVCVLSMEEEHDWTIRGCTIDAGGGDIELDFAVGRSALGGGADVGGVA